MVKKLPPPPKYLVLKVDDIVKYLSIEQRQDLNDITQTIDIGRGKSRKKVNNKYHVCNRDEPYADSVLTSIVMGEINKLDGIEDIEDEDSEDFGERQVYD